MVWRDTTAERVLFIGTPSVTLNMEGHDSNMEGHDSNDDDRVWRDTTAIWRDAHFFFITRQLSQ